METYILWDFFAVIFFNEKQNFVGPFCICVKCTVNKFELHLDIRKNGELAASALVEFSKGLKQMRDKKLYTELNFETFEDYVENAVGIRQRQAYNYIQALENLGENIFALYDIIAELFSNNQRNYIITAEMLKSFNLPTIFTIAKAFRDWLTEKREEYKLTVPDCPNSEVSDNSGYSFPVMTYDEKIIRDYCGLSFSEMDNLVVFGYWRLLRDAVVFELKKTPGGREMLEAAYCFEQTEPDREALFARGMKVAK